MTKISISESQQKAKKGLRPRRVKAKPCRASAIAAGLDPTSPAHRRGPSPRLQAQPSKRKGRKMSERLGVYEEITNKIVASLEQGNRPWANRWAGQAMMPTRANGEHYQGINVLVLWLESAQKGYASPHWLTFKQAQELGACVRKGEKGTGIIYANRIETREENEQTGEIKARGCSFVRRYVVFNADQIEGLPEQFFAGPQAINPDERDAHADLFFKSLGANIMHEGDRAVYVPARDEIRMPAFECFTDANAYYATLAHETVHWTGHHRRLDRELGCKKWGDEGYAMEELIAEIGAAFVCADLGLAAEPREDHATYIASWLKVLKNDAQAIFTAASHAQKAANYIKKL